MPERVIAQSEAQRKRAKLTLGSVFSLTLEPDRTHNGDRSEEVTRLLKENAFRFFLHGGGHAEDWGEDEEQDVVDDLVKRWKESEWGQLWSRRHHQLKNQPGQLYAGGTQWFGTSFEIGNLMGVNILHGHEHPSTHTMSRKPKDTSSLAATTGKDTFVTARSSLDPTPVAPQMSVQVSSADSQTYNQAQADAPTPASSRTGLLATRDSDRERHIDSANGGPSSIDRLKKAKSEIYLRPSLVKDEPKASARTDGEVLASHAKGKAKVHYADLAEEAAITVPSGPQTPGPRPPEEVLERTNSTVDVNTSLAATAVANEMSESPSSDFHWGDVVLRGGYQYISMKYTNINFFDDSVNRTTRGLRYEDWGEFLVAWRRDSIEIYRDHNTPGKEWVTKRKHLCYVIPLRSSRTRMSLYSFVDLTFCITCAPTTTRLNETSSRWIFSREKEGTNIFIFKVKSRSRAYDWAWQLWRQMGGQVPKSIDIHNPRLSTKVTIDVPENEQANTASLYRLFKRRNVIDLCMQSLQAVPAYKYLIETEIRDGRSLQLSWRHKATLDWIWLDEDTYGQPREWSVLCGVAFKQSSQAPVLEIRVAQHAPTHLHLKDGTRISEPPGIEGYLERIRPNTQTKHQLYLATHNGYMFILNAYTPFPPLPPGLIPPQPSLSEAQNLRHTEIRRGTNQIMTATGVFDLRTIVAVRRAFQITPASTHNHRQLHDDDSASFRVFENPEERTPEDEEDEGGEAFLSKSVDRPRTRTRRSFELLLNTGHVIRLEAYSCRVAIEWIERLRALIVYWKRRHRMDAKQEIDLAQAQRPRLTPQTRVCQDEHEVPPEAPADLSSPYEAMDLLYNRCVLEGCKPIVKGGRIYMKKGLRGQYKLVQLFLVAGHLVRFKIGSHSMLYSAMKKKINILDAYVCSGYLAAQTLPKGQYQPNAAPTPRRYQDGLETDDREEDMLFMICYRPQPQMMNADQDPTTTPVNSKSMPGLSAKHKMLVFKTRSVLERDAWCWALNSEIEKIVRAQKDREERLRSAGNLVELK
ncbi:unnamed protein product [Cyclocybe aegerita]|uniref:PH domain-containing protein n=1 Tax=Cyclocybe aegerita TaxID=1973307 RepID=A0A8S0XG32_CYCAE|nr:unnamed protein product [Cyclocybe aegerita]